MSRIAEKFATLARRGEKALITFITAGDPDLATTEKLIPLMERAGADIIELGVPFSDPMADGPTIQLASERALAAGTTVAKILAMVKSVRHHSQVPLLLMGYYNPIFVYGPEKFLADAAAAGVDGVLLVDLPPEEAGDFKAMADRHGVNVIFLLTPTSDKARLDKVARLGSGFIYYVSVTGVTGARQSVDSSVFDAVTGIKAKVRLPLAVGFGIADPEQAGRVASVADGVVVGSAIVKLFETHRGKALEDSVTAFVTSLKAGIVQE
ncbi:tryptophan synthase subunit alpha [Geobacter sp. AOG1]|uniref:tryptophan synthase subunit alpha n=1 Tax=Geobacter sp. AOG1 TaxID=1566346 RepID=UPI001CC4DA1F|nr:tryptophan synthase subunit alpha [Geobacter sp. AOG1]GFE59008.1 tryptophan synthase alpha chain [Geobacter sp. AOG1]